MTSRLTVLKTANGRPATKTLIQRSDGTIGKLHAAPARYFTIERRAAETIYDLAEILTALSAEPQKLVIRGEPIPGLDLSLPVRRLKHCGSDKQATFRSSPAGEKWVCFDFDEIPCPDSIDAGEHPGNALLLLSYLLPAEFHDVTFWAQWSSGAGLDDWKTLSAHLWFMLDRPVTDDNLRAWAVSSNAPIDPCLFNAVQPHFTAAPILSSDVEDPTLQRHGLIKGSRDVVEFTAAKKPKRHDTDRTSRSARAPGPHSEGTRTAA